MPCATTTLPTTTPGLSTPTTAPFSTSTTTAQSTTPSTTTLDCTDVYPERKNGETWDAGNCTTAECINGVVKTKSTPCSTVQEPLCANGRKPVKMDNKDGCCFHYECECVCSVWSGTHYKTFDGKNYDFNKNCTYYLVKEMINTYNLTITVNNHVCEPSEDTFCPQDLTVMYQSYKIVFTQIKTSESTVNAVYLNDERIYPAYQNSDLLITSTDIAVTLEIPGISTEVVYRGSSISIELAFSLFEGNTEGQCGTCDNSANNDCRSPNGQVESCSDSAGQWLDPKKPCNPLTTIEPPVTSTRVPQTTTQPPCNTAICDLLNSSVFEPCHSVIPRGSYLKTCTSDICINGNNTCTSLEAYAAECSNAGVCINWRNATNGQCEHKCQGNQVYRACGPKVEQTCIERYNKKFDARKNASNNSSQEGCFCTDGTTLFNTVYGKCVAYCGCVGPDGNPKKPGETWTVNCKNCMCNKDSMSVVCEPVNCTSVSTPDCTAPYKLVNKTEGCCYNQTCECDKSLCPAPMQCSLGFKLEVTQSDCCKSYKCVPKGVCVYNMTEYQPGDKVPTPEPEPEAPIEEPVTVKNISNNSNTHRTRTNLWNNSATIWINENISNNSITIWISKNLSNNRITNRTSRNLWNNSATIWISKNISNNSITIWISKNSSNNSITNRTSRNLWNNTATIWINKNISNNSITIWISKNSSNNSITNRTSRNLWNNSATNRTSRNLWNNSATIWIIKNISNNSITIWISKNISNNSITNRTSRNLWNNSATNRTSRNLWNHSATIWISKNSSKNSSNNSISNRTRRNLWNNTATIWINKNISNNSITIWISKNSSNNSITIWISKNSSNNSITIWISKNSSNNSITIWISKNSSNNSITNRTSRNLWNNTATIWINKNISNNSITIWISKNISNNSITNRTRPCQECYCGPNMNPNTSINIITCKPIVCKKNCSEDSEYQTIPEECCGTCVQTKCTLLTANNTKVYIEINQTYTSPEDKCMHYTCEKINGQLVTSKIVVTCPYFNPLDCEPGTETTDANGCCKSCKPRSVCEVLSNKVVIAVGKCESPQPVNMTYCAGHCGSMSKYSAEANMMMHKCECCQEFKTSQKQVELNCDNGSKLQHAYVFVEACRCQPAECVPGTTSKPQRRRRR
ncbi:unnamed protein product [Pleuronectes platessa]|uniref:Uncharacterized protein n=1 Tax=Pleuronectes platessa TaxID=8262 RepID=A0A9N7VL08_PLEPL|nr:unnamed protein product [Pleuronectes platessa]